MTDAHSPQPSDRSLLRRFRSGEQEAATRLYLRYARRLHGLATAQTSQDIQSRVDPEDIVQSVFRTFFRRAKDGHYDVPDGEELWKLFLVIGLHKIRDAAAFHRAAKRDVTRTLTIGQRGSNDDPVAVDTLAETTLKIVIDEVLERLSAVQRQIILLRLEGSPVEDIAAETQRSGRTVERTLQKFRHLLREQIDESLRNDDTLHISDGGSVQDGKEPV